MNRLREFFSERIIPILLQYKLVFLLTGLFLFVLGTYWYVGNKRLLRFQAQENERLAVEMATTPSWERKVETDQIVKFGVVTELRLQMEDNYSFASDIEDRYYAVEKYVKPLAFFRSRMDTFKPDFIVSLGDMINGEDQDLSRGSDALHFVRAHLEKVGAPILWVIGNRELRAITRVEFQEVTDAPKAPYVVDRDDYRFIVLDSNFNEDGEAYDANVSHYSRGYMPQEQLVWLEEELKTSRHVFVFMHHGAFVNSVRASGKDDQKEKSIKNSRELRGLFAKYNVSAVFTGQLKAHVYENTDGVEYYALEDLRDYSYHPGAFYSVTVDGGQANVDLHYIDRDNEELVSEPYKEDAYIITPADNKD